jgi:DNA-binding GntR family transcriptional regulator
MVILNKGNSEYPLARTMSEFIYIKLKESIINNELKANQRINEKELVDHFKVSRTPIREAILRLEAKGFVRIDSYRRAIVREISYKELMEIFQVLGALDRLAVSQAADNLTPQNIEKLEGFIEKMEKYCSLKSIEKYFEFNEKFHDEIWKAVNNELLLEILHSVRDRMQRYTYARISAFKRPEALEKSLKQHKALLTALKGKDKDKLKKMIVEHRVSLLKIAPYANELKEYLSTE